MVESLHGIDCDIFVPVGTFFRQPLVAGIVVDFGDTRTYLHGASSNEHREMMAPTFLHWEIMRDAKARGMRFYDWWGIAPDGSAMDHPWTGITRFKTGFPGERISSPGTYDIVLRPITYKMYNALRRVRRIIARP